MRRTADSFKALLTLDRNTGRQLKGNDMRKSSIRLWPGILLTVALPIHATSPLYTVTSTGGGGVCNAGSTSDANCTFDAAIADAQAGPAGAIIQFAPAVQRQTIIVFPQTNLTKDITIDGSPNGVVLDGQNIITIFHISSGVNVSLSHLTLQHGIGYNYGGAIYSDSGNLTVNSCTFANNSALSGGAAIENWNGTATIINSTFASNTVGTDVYGGTGAAIQSYGTLVIANSTITGNNAAGGSAGGSGGGVAASNGSLVLLSTIVAGNTATSDPDISSSHDFTVATSLGYNLIGDGTDDGFTPTTGDQVGTGAAPINAQFSASGLTSNGGATKTVALLSTSPAAGMGYCAGNVSSPTLPAVTLDQRDYERDTPCEIGAYDLKEIFADGFDR